MMYILDTNVISEFRKMRRKKADPKVTAWAKTAKHSDLFLSAISIMELQTGILLLERRDSHQGSILRAWFEKSVLLDFSNRIISIDTQVALCCAQLHVPDKRSEHDALIAATALVHGLTVVTRNVRDFQHTGVSVLNPWE